MSNQYPTGAIPMHKMMASGASKGNEAPKGSQTSSESKSESSSESKSVTPSKKK